MKNRCELCRRHKSSELRRAARSSVAALWGDTPRRRPCRLPPTYTDLTFTVITPRRVNHYTREPSGLAQARPLKAAPNGKGHCASPVSRTNGLWPRGGLVVVSCLFGGVCCVRVALVVALVGFCRAFVCCVAVCPLFSCRFRVARGRRGLVSWCLVVSSSSSSSSSWPGAGASSWSAACAVVSCWGAALGLVSFRRLFRPCRLRLAALPFCRGGFICAESKSARKTELRRAAWSSGAALKVFWNCPRRSMGNPCKTF